MTNCQCFDKCSAPFCPLDRESLGGVWYPNEEICRNRKFASLDWIKRQKKIAKRAKQIDRYFTLEMLKHNCIVGKAMTGLDPGKDRGEQLGRWFKRHPLRKKLTDQQRKQVAQRLKQARQAKLIQPSLLDAPN